MEEADLLDPNPDIRALFCHYNEVYFYDKLHACTVDWSSSRMTLCAGICKYMKGSCEIRLSEPLLKFRSSSELKETLLHEMIHAYLWLTDSNKDHEDHGPCFQNMMQAINNSQAVDHQRPGGGYHISIYHNFSEEVNSYRKHHWKCMRCRDLIKRAHNRAPSQADCYQKIAQGMACQNEHCHWHIHQRDCGGEYEKISEPEGYKDRRAKSLTRGKVTTAENEILPIIDKEKDRFKQSKVSSAKIKNSKENTSSGVQKGTSLEMYFSTESKDAREVTASKIEDGEICGDCSSEEPLVGKRPKKMRREDKADEIEEESGGASSFETVMAQTDKCTVIIGWKGWYAFESEEDEKALDNKRSWRKMLEITSCPVQDLFLTTSPLQGPESGSREVVEFGELEAIDNEIARRPLLEDGESMPWDVSAETPVTCDSTMLVCSERAVTVNRSCVRAVEKQSPGEASIFKTACEFSSSAAVLSCPNTLASQSVKQTSVSESWDCTAEGFVNTEESKEANLDKGGHKMLAMEARSGRALQEKTIGGESGVPIGGKVRRKERSKRSTRGGGILIEKGPSVACPICQGALFGDIKDVNFNSKFNEHMDACMGTFGT